MPPPRQIDPVAPPRVARGLFFGLGAITDGRETQKPMLSR
jgi:hypothetical protein